MEYRHSRVWKIQVYFCTARLSFKRNLDAVGGLPLGLQLELFGIEKTCTERHAPAVRPSRDEPQAKPIEEDLQGIATECFFQKHRTVFEIVLR